MQKRQCPGAEDEPRDTRILFFGLEVGSASIRGKFARRNTMATLKHIGPGSAFKVGLVVYAVLGLIIGICMALFSMMIGSLGSMSGAAGPAAKAFGFGFGLGSIIIFPILYGIIGGIAGALGAVVYNLVAGWVGGLELDIS
jgi:hypothetical protein